MRLLILDEGYPRSGVSLGDPFVHVRAKEYAKKHTVQVYIEQNRIGAQCVV